jgi:hypothetical protein
VGCAAVMAVGWGAPLSQAVDIALLHDGPLAMLAAPDVCRVLFVRVACLG